MKKYFTIALVAILLVMVFFLYLKLEEQKPVDPSVFAENVQNSDSLFIIQDLRDASSVSRINIMQCGVDFASSQRIAGKNIVIFAFEGKECISLDGITTIDDCSKQLNAPFIHIKTGNLDNTIFYKDRLLVNVDDNYQKGECSIN